MGVEAGVGVQPGSDLGALVGGVVVHDEVDLDAVAAVGVGACEVSQERQELLVPVPVLAYAGDFPGGDL